MALERWGTLSVRDHLDLEGLIANVILYDRLVFPVPADMPEIKRWWHEKWGPDLLNERLAKLGDLAIKRPWDAARQERYHHAIEAARAVGFDADNIVKDSQAVNPYQTTRMVLADESVALPPGVTRVDVVAAFNSEEALKATYQLQKQDAKNASALLLRHEIALPAEAKLESSFEKAIALSKDKDFQDKRRDFYEWQDNLLQGKVSPTVIEKELTELIEGYNRSVEKAFKKVKRKFAFMVAGITLNLLGAAISLNPLPAVGALITFASFKLLDGKPAIDAGRNRPAAMFHDAKKLFE